MSKNGNDTAGAYRTVVAPLPTMSLNAVLRSALLYPVDDPMSGSQYAFDLHTCVHEN
jgi:hypothetical protein